jgi:ATP-dependent phosphofructokinase / diphosphate-dependent phosphofructokinase
MKGYNNHKKVAMLFSGGPAPAANAVISSVALNFIDAGITTLGFFSGFEGLENYDPKDRFSMAEGVHYQVLDSTIGEIRNQRGIYLRTSRANPGRQVKSKNDLKDPEKNKKLLTIMKAFDYLGIGYLITIGGDDTLKTANFFNLLGMPVIHIPKTIDNDYHGIAWTFGYWTAVQAAREILLNLKADALSTHSYYIVELMGRKAGWVNYAAGIAGEAIMMVSIEDVVGDVLDLEKLAEQIVDVMLKREKDHKYYGVVCVAESLAEVLPDKYKPSEVDTHGNIIYGAAEVGRLVHHHVEKIYKQKTGIKKKIVFKQIGYELRNCEPISYDVVLGSMLGFGAYKLFKQGQFGHMVTVSENFTISAVPFTDLIDQKTLLTRLRDVPRDGDFFALKNALSYKLLD